MRAVARRLHHGEPGAVERGHRRGVRSSMSTVPVIDLSGWFDGTARDEVAGAIDAALQDVGFFLVTGHGVAPDARAAVRAAAREFFALPRQVKQRYAVTVAGR